MTDHARVLNIFEGFLTKHGIKDRGVLDGLKALRQTDSLTIEEAEQACLLVRHFVEELGHKSVKRDLLKAVDDLKEELFRRP